MLTISFLSYGPATQTSIALQISPVAQSAFFVHGPNNPDLHDPELHVRGEIQSAFVKHGPSSCDLHTEEEHISGLTHGRVTQDCPRVATTGVLFVLLDLMKK